MTELTDDDINEVLNYKGKGIPLRYWPNECYHSKPQNGWENERFKEHWPNSGKYWLSMASFVRRQIKLNAKRKVNPLYCNKSALNYSYYHKFVKFKYNGCLLNN